MTSFFQISNWIIAIILLIFTNGCRPRRILLIDQNRALIDSSTVLFSDLCTNRNPQNSFSPPISPLAPSSVLIGWRTNYNKYGWELLGCDRLAIGKIQSVFKFNLSSLADSITFGAFKCARLVIRQYHPISQDNTLRIHSGQTWGSQSAFNTDGYVYRDFYEVKLVTQNWLSSTTQVNSTLLPQYSDPVVFEVPISPFSMGSVNHLIYLNTGFGEIPAMESAVIVDVSQVIRRVLENHGVFDNGIFGFSIEPAWFHSRMKQNNSVFGSIQVSLELYY